MQIHKITEEASQESLRSESDRRADDIKFWPDKIERRRIVERRLPSVDENVASFSDWAKSMVSFLVRSRRQQAKTKLTKKRVKPQKW
jgi:hypothetical protein